MSVDVSGLEQRVREYSQDRIVEAADRFRDIARSTAPRRTGELADSIEVTDISSSGDTFTATVECGAEYGIYQDQGTGIFGPRGRVLFADELTAGWRTKRGTPVHRFVFDWPAAGGIVFARRVQGTEATHFWQRAIDRAGEVWNG